MSSVVGLASLGSLSAARAAAGSAALRPSVSSPMSNQNPSAAVRKADASVKCVTVGDGGLGKTCLLSVYAYRKFPEDYVPTVFETYVTHTPSPLDSSKTVELALWDTAGQEEFDRLRPLSYTDVGVMLICFAVDYPTSLENVVDKVEHFCADVPIVLVGTKTDLRRDKHTLDMLKAQGLRPVTAQQGQVVADKIGARYAECSARNNEGVDDVFNIAMTLALRRIKASASRKKKKRGDCAIL